MAGDPEPEQFDDETLEGGPVKSFLEHLEDLRWVILKSVVALFLGMLICLLGAQHVVEILKWPLRHAPAPSVGTNQVVSINLGTNRLTTIHLTPAQGTSFHLGTNQFVAVQIEPLMIGSNQVLS